QLADVGDLHEAGAGVVRLVAHHAIELCCVRDDLVDGEHGVRWCQYEIFHAHVDWLGGREFDGFGGDAVGFLDHLRRLGNFPAARPGDADERSRPHDVVLARRHIQRRRRHPGLLLEVGAFARGEVLPLVVDLDRRVHALDVLVLEDGIHHLLYVILLGFARDGVGVLDDWRRPVSLIRGNRRQTHVDLFGDRAGFGDLGRHLCDAPDLVFADERAAGKSPGAAVNHANAEAGGAGPAGALAAAASEPESAAAPAEVAAPAASAPAAEAATAKVAFVVGLVAAMAAAGGDAAVDGAREPDVGVGAARALGFRERDV